MFTFRSFAINRTTWPAKRRKASSKPKAKLVQHALVELVAAAASVVQQAGRYALVVGDARSSSATTLHRGPRS